MMIDNFIALGTNLGNREANLKNTLAMLEKKVQIMDKSHMYVTKPWGFLDQPDFLNMVIKTQTDLLPDNFLIYLKKLELELGRVFTFQYGPRLIDLDIIFYGNEIINKSNLIIPHPHLQERAFVLIPLCEIAPTLIHPVLGLSTIELVKKLNDKEIKIYKQEEVPEELIFRSILSPPAFRKWVNLSDDIKNSLLKEIKLNNTDDELMKLKIREIVNKLLQM